MEKHVVILGCGFGGLFAAKALSGAAVRVTVIDRANHHLFQPLLYQVATAGLSAPAIAAPIRQILEQQKNTTVLMADATSIDPERRVVVLDEGEEIAYDFLIVATGATHSYFGHPEWERDAPGLKTLEDAFEIRRRILVAYERAERETDPARRVPWLTFAVVGAGATGVEMAGTLAEISRHTLRGEFRRFDSREARVILLEGTSNVLSTYPEDLSRKARRQLERLGVVVRTDTRVTGIDADGVMIGAERLAAKTVIWAAGVAASPLGKSLGVPLDRAGRVPVGADLSVAGRPEVFVIGDLAAAMSDGKPVPGISPAAKQMGRYVAKCILQRMRGEPSAPFRYIDYGQLATIGRNAAVAIIGKLKISGYPAWLVWLFAHIYFLIGFRNRIVVLFDWALAYWSFERNARIVAGSRDNR
jgi:NADH:quinone reductase (non-electrogenic)